MSWTPKTLTERWRERARERENETERERGGRGGGKRVRESEKESERKSERERRRERVTHTQREGKILKKLHKSLQQEWNFFNLIVFSHASVLHFHSSFVKFQTILKLKNH